MAINCLACGQRLRRGQIDVASDRATCAGCGKAMSFRAASRVSKSPAARRVLRMLATPGLGVLCNTGSAATRPPAVDPANPPRGAWFTDDGLEVRVGATTRSIGRAIFMLPIGATFCVVAGFFMAFSIVSVLQSLGIMSTASGRAGSLGGGVCVLVFAAPSAGAGLWVLWSAAMAAGGRVAVTLRGDDLEVFTGIGPAGRRRRFSAASVERVIEDVRVIRTSRGATHERAILLRMPAGEEVWFGAGLSQKRRSFVAGMLKRVLGR